MAKVNLVEKIELTSGTRTITWKTLRGNRRPTKVSKGEGLSYGQTTTERKECRGGDEKRRI